MLASLLNFGSDGKDTCHPFAPQLVAYSVRAYVRTRCLCSFSAGLGA